MRRVVEPWRCFREVSCRLAIGVALALVGLAIAAAGASAASLTVNTLGDNPAAAGECSGLPSDCSLRQALDKAASGDTITFDVSGTITLVNGALAAKTTVTVNGPGASQLAIDGGGSTRILNVNGPNAPALLTISGLTLQNGQAAEGGAIYISGGSKLAASSDAFAHDTASGGGGAGLGGAIATDDRASESVSVKDSSFTSNSATGATAAEGGAIYVDGPLSIEGSTFTENIATYGDGGKGGAVYTTDGSISNSTFTGNSAAGGYGQGGALYTLESTLTDDTIDGNTATGTGGGIDGPNVVAYGTILVGNKLTNGRTEDCGASVANARSTTSYNLAGVTCTLRPLAVAPMLGTLADNGGPTQTQAITPNDPAYGAVPAAVCHAAPFLPIDQRGLPRPGTGETNCDIGAYEFQASTTVTSLAASPNPSTAGAQVSYTATVSPAPDGGTMTFTDAGAAISGCGAVPVSPTGQASCQVTYPVAGSHSIAASYSGDPRFASSRSPKLVEMVQPVSNAGHGSVARAYVGNVTVSGQRVTAAVTCQGASGSSCAVKLRLSVAVRHGSRRAKTVIVGITKVVTVRAGHTRKITASLNSTGRQLLKKHHELGVKLAILQSHNGRSATIFTRTVTFKETKKKKK